MPRVHVIFATLALGLALAGCNETNADLGGPSTSMAASAGGSSSYRLPPGAPCTGEINRYHDVVKGDLATGNVEQKVYDQIDTELHRAATSCSSGKGGEAHSIVAASKARHGYRA